MYVVHQANLNLEFQEWFDVRIIFLVGIVSIGTIGYPDLKSKAIPSLSLNDFVGLSGLEIIKSQINAFLGCEELIPPIFKCPNEPVDVIELLMLPVPVTVVNEPAAFVVPPITVLSIVPPSISGVLISGLVKVLFVKV